MELCDSIRELRKQKQLRQEELAEAMGVSTASVSKWETGQCAPELTVLMELADFFEVSLDTLVGHSLKEDRVRDLLAQLEQAGKAGEEDRAISLCEKLLRNYPNHKPVVEACASAYYRQFIQTGKKDYMESCVRQTRRLMAICQGEPEAERLQRLQSLANQYELLEQWDSAKDCYEQSNVQGCNDASIANCLLRQGEAQRAVTLLSGAFDHAMFNLLTTLTRLADSWVALGEREKACAALNWVDALLGSVQGNSTVRMSLRLQLAEIHAAAGQTEAAKTDLHSAARLLQQDESQDRILEADFLRFEREPELLISAIPPRELLRQTAEALGPDYAKLLPELLRSE